MSLKVFEIDPTLKSVGDLIWERVKGFRWWKDELQKLEGGIYKFAGGYDLFGFTCKEGSITYREWVPNAKQVFLIGDFNKWENTTPLASEGFGRWAVELKDCDGKPAIPHKCQVKVRIETNDHTWIERVPAWTRLAWQDHNTNLFNGVMWHPPPGERYTFKHERPSMPASPKIYEAHVGMSSKEPKVATYLEFAETVIPRIKRMGYNTIQLMAVAEHAFYGSFGYHVTNYFAPSSRCGTPEELKRLVDEAHGLGMVVIMDLVHAHCSSNSLDGIAMMDGTDHCYTHGGPKGHHSQWDSKLFHYTKHEVLRFLLSNIRYWLEEFRFDGFRFDGVTSMLYHSHGIGKGFSGNYHDYFGGDADLEGQIYLMLANELVHHTLPSAITVAEEVSGMPTLCLPIDDGGFGFNYRLAMAVPDMWIKLLKEVPDDLWDVGYICHTLTNRRWKEKCIAYAESHDQSIVGDKTIAFWLMDQEMYYGMSLASCPEPSIVVDRGLALHKVLRLLVMGLGGAGYLNFMGNEFGHPEWVDFPRAENAWSHHFCRRRWDLADDEALRYKYFQNFDELMQALENRFKWLSSEHEFVTICNGMDKVLAFERGDLVFVVNLDPNLSFQGYQVGIGKDQEMRIVLDTDEERFGGQCRLEEGHGKLPTGGPTHNRPSSCYLYLPCRTAQVLAPADLLEGGIRIWLDAKLLQENNILDPSDVNLALEIRDGGKKYLRQFRFDLDACVRLRAYFDAVFALIGPTGATLLSCRVHPDGMFHIYFPGDYTVYSPGYLDADLPQRPFRAAKLSRERSAVPSLSTAQEQYFDPSFDAGLVYPDAMVLGPSTSQLLEEMPTPPTLSPKKTPSVSSLTTPKHATSEPERSESRIEPKTIDFPSRKSARLDDLSKIFKDFGLHHCNGGWLFRDWIPNATYVSLVGDFNGWKETATPLRKDEKAGPDIWSCFIGSPLNAAMTKGSQYRLHVVPAEGEPREMMPLWAIRYAVNSKSQAVNAVVWPTSISRGPSRKDLHEKPLSLKGKKLHLLEFDITLVSQKDEKSSLKFARTILARAAHSGYHGVVIVGLFHAGVRATSSLLAATPALKDASDFGAFLQYAHDRSLAVFLEIPSRSIAGKSYLPSYFFTQKREVVQKFDFGKKEVAQYLLYCLQHWVEAGVDGFRLEGLPGAALSDDSSSADDFVMIANDLLHSAAQSCSKDVVSIGTGNLEDGLCDTQDAGGFGFDLWQPCNGIDLSRLVPGSCCLDQGAYGPRGKVTLVQNLVDALTEPLKTKGRSQLLTSMETMDEFIVSQSPLSICMLSWETLYTVSGGAAAPYVTGLAEALVRRGHEVHVFTRASHGLKINVETVNGVVYHEVPYLLSMDFVEETANFCKALADAITQREAAFGHFDVAHGHEWLVARARSGLRKDLHFVLTAHSTEEGRSAGAEFGGQSSQVVELEGEAFRSIDQLFAPSQMVRESMYSQYGLEGKDVSVMHNGANAQKKSSKEAQKEARDTLGLPENSPVILYTGRLLPHKGVDLLVEAIPFVLQHWRDAHFVIVGTGHLRGSLERRIEELGIGKAVTFKVSKCEGEEKRRYLEACDAVAVPSRSDFYGVDVIESWAAARPVVGIASGELRHLIKPDCTGYTADQEMLENILRFSSGSLAWGLCKICENREHACWMGQQGWEQVQQSFLWDTIAKRTEKFYINMLGLQEAPRTLGRRRPLAAALGADAVWLLRLCRLLSFAFGGDATLSCLGSDFGWQGRVDYPRKGNDFSDKLARIPVELAEDKTGKHKLLAMFQMCLIRTERCLQWLVDPAPQILLKDEKKQLLIFSRGCSVFAFNFSSGKVSNLSLNIPRLKGITRNFKCVLNTQDQRFGGAASDPAPVVPLTDGEMKLVLLAQSAMVLAPAEVDDAMCKDQVLQLRSADEFIDLVRNDIGVSPIVSCQMPTFDQMAAEAKDAGKDAIKADAAEADTGKADTTKAEAAKAEAVKVDAPKADTAKADEAKADSAKTDNAKGRHIACAAGLSAIMSRATKADAAKADTTKAEASKAEAEKSDAARAEATKADAAKAEASKAEAEKSDAARAEATKADTAKAEASKAKAEKSDAARAEATKADAAKAEASKAEAEKSDAARAEATKADTTKAEASKAEAEKSDAARAEATKADAAKAEASTAEAEKSDAARAEATKADAAKAEASTAEAVKVDVVEASADKADETKADIAKTDGAKGRQH
eukprot:s648_g4.t1